MCELIDNIEDSELVVVVGDQLPFDSRLEGKVFVTHVEQLFSPEDTIKQALTKNEDYVATN